MISERLRTARLLAGLTQSQSVQKLGEMGIPLTKGGLSKYERGGSIPPPSLIIPLAKIYNVKPAYFLRQSGISVEWFAFRRHASLGARKQEAIKAKACDLLAGHVWLTERMLPNLDSSFPGPVPVSSPDEAESAAEYLRDKWGLGQSPIQSVTQTIESKGGFVVDCDFDGNEFDGLSGLVNGRYPTMVSASNIPDDRKRFNLSHEIGHLVMDCIGLDAKAEESLAHRFAGAFLVPRDTVIDELGEARKDISFDELAALKTKHGLSMQAWLFRAKDLSIVSDRRFRDLYIRFSQNGWRSHEPVDYHGNEKPVMLKQLAMRALSEGIITPERASELCVDLKPNLDGWSRPARQPAISAEDLLHLPEPEKRRVLALAAEILKRDYETDVELTAFEAFGDEE